MDVNLVETEKEKTVFREFINKPVHSDFLIHWTGEDIDKDLGENYNKSKDWQNKTSSETCSKAIDEYLRRLKFILKYGLWMTKRRGNDDVIQINCQKFSKPRISRACFTELQLSETRKHAKKFGRLGIGVKRYFL